MLLVTQRQAFGMENGHPHLLAPVLALPVLALPVPRRGCLGSCCDYYISMMSALTWLLNWSPFHGGSYKGGLLGFLSTISCTIASTAGHKNVTVTDQMGTQNHPLCLMSCCITLVLFRI